MTAPDIFAAGAVLWRPAGESIEVALIHRPKYDDWTFPKGKLKKGEPLLHAALREVQEETGIVPVLGRPLAPSLYDKAGRLKRVDYWAATAADDRVEAVMDADEVDGLEWVPLDEASQWLTYDRDQPVLRDFANGPRLTVPLVLVRHGIGISKGDWPDNEELRTLNYRGRQSAQSLASQLANFAPTRAFTAPNARCVETLLPLTSIQGIELAVAPQLNADSALADEMAKRCQTLLSQGQSTVVCGHGAFLTELLSHLCEQLGAEAPTEEPLGKGEFWVAHTTDEQLLTIERHQA